ncbi:MAG: hypothetical protein JSS10_06910 [Verrucomicrobia bacterium]|nr:hypothetical protein [Verrucomicrobiota bacterium]
MSKLCRVFFFVFIAVCSGVRAETHDLDKYRVTILKIEEELHSIALSNGMICHVIPSKWGIEKSFAIGDKIQVTPNLWHIEKKGSLHEEGNFRLFFSKDQKGGNLPVWVSEESNPLATTYVSDVSICTQPAGWFSSEKLLQVIELSDGSKWGLHSEPVVPIQKFAKAGDRILVTFLLEPNLYVLTNLDRLNFFIDSSKEACGFYRFILVTPYQEKKPQ